MDVCMYILASYYNIHSPHDVISPASIKIFSGSGNQIPLPISIPSYTQPYAIIINHKSFFANLPPRLTWLPPLLSTTLQEPKHHHHNPPTLNKMTIPEVVAENDYSTLTES